MARGYNFVQLIGNLGADPEMRYTGSGDAVVNLRVAENRAYKRRDGEQVEQTVWHNAVAFGRTAEVIGEYLHKGDEIQIMAGRLDYNEWTDRDGNDRITAEIHILNFRFGRKAGDNNGNTQGGGTTAKPKARKVVRKAPKKAEPDDTFAPDDDLPF